MSFFFHKLQSLASSASDEYDSLGKTIAAELLPFEISLQKANRSRLGGRECSSFLCGMEFCKIVIQEACTLKGGLSTVGGKLVGCMGLCLFFSTNPIARILTSDEYDSLGKTITAEWLPFEISLQIPDRFPGQARDDGTYYVVCCASWMTAIISLVGLLRCPMA